MKLVVEAMNKCGRWTNSVLREAYKDPNSRFIPTQEDFYQPLKYADIHYVCNVGAIKSSYYNVNPYERITDPNAELNFFKLKIMQLGIQLDKEHEVDDEDVTTPT
ncbi:MAG: hypothetical protein HUJ56_11100 [Erysipelotrichaceae bacterium]|nr:hypothetical protein [Erysipelotrichaceae bacterium]